jgi:hypothetical protein
MSVAYIGRNDTIDAGACRARRRAQERALPGDRLAGCASLVAMSRDFIEKPQPIPAQVYRIMYEVSSAGVGERHLTNHPGDGHELRSNTI